jgi:hypothetical protein
VGNNISPRGVEIAKSLCRGSWDCVATEKILGKGFRRLKLGGSPAGAETSEPGGVKRINNAFGQRRLGANHRQPDIELPGAIAQAINVFGADIDIINPRLERGAGIARRNINVISLRRAR